MNAIIRFVDVSAELAKQRAINRRCRRRLAIEQARMREEDRLDERRTSEMLASLRLKTRGWWA